MSSGPPPQDPAPDRPAPRTRGLRWWLRIAIPLIATAVIVAPLAWFWQASRVPDEFSVMDMGYLDYGGGPVSDHGGAHGGGDHGSHQPAVSVADLTADPGRPADLSFELVTRAATLNIGGREMAGFTVNGKSPGPTLTVRQGQLIEVHVRNESVAAGVSMHWHGVNVPNAMDGVAGVTQNAIGVGESFVYRFEVADAGSFWYHSHQVSNTQVLGGLFGALVVLPRRGPPAGNLDVTAVAHTYTGVRTINGVPGDLPVAARPGQRVRLRVVNTDNAPMEIWAGAPYRVLAIDGTDIRGPTPVSEQALTLTAGGRADIEIGMPADGLAVRVQLSRATAVLLGAPGRDAPAPVQPANSVDLLEYGTKAAFGLDPARATRRFEYVIGRVPGFVNGRPGMWWSVNGHLYPDVPMYVVRRGEIATMRIENRSGEVHPMHLHGHRAVVLSRNGVRATGSPWWVDSLNVLDKERYEIAFRADNPGIWMDHCHNLQHAAEGMIAHLMYEGVDTPYRVGGEVDNQPE